VRDIDREPVKSGIVSAVVAWNPWPSSKSSRTWVRLRPGFYFARPQPAATFDKLLSPSVPSPPDLRLVRDGESLAG
jgi:hypothetical protein